MSTVYLETTIIGHLAGRLHPNPFVAARQQVTRDWWNGYTVGHSIFISELVMDECSQGDPSAAAERLTFIKEVEQLESSLLVDHLAQALLAGKAIPPSEPRDAFHIAIAAFHGINYLLTWNFKHIANAALRSKINQICRSAGLEPPIICTPEELMGIDDGAKSHY